MAANHDHKKVIAKVRKLMGEIFDESDQSIYVYLDKENKVCNDRFAFLLGYRSAKEWGAVKTDFAATFVTPKDRSTLVTAYQNAIGDLVASTISVKWKKKGKGEVATTTIMVPLVFEGHRMALHFIKPNSPE